jgi:Zinc knuckle
MDIDDRITRVKNLIQKREEIDTELANLFGITIKAKKMLRCSKCGEEGHNAKTCPSHEQQQQSTA